MGLLFLLTPPKTVDPWKTSNRGIPTPPQAFCVLNRGSGGTLRCPTFRDAADTAGEVSECFVHWSSMCSWENPSG